MADLGTLKPGEPHPMAYSAKDWIARQGDLGLLRESFASCAIEGNRVGEICGATLERLLNGEPVSDRYLLGLAWFMRESEALAAGEALDELLSVLRVVKDKPRSAQAHRMAIQALAKYDGQ